MFNQKLNELLEIELRECELQIQLKQEITEKIELIKQSFPDFLVSNKAFQETNSLKFEFSYSNCSLFKLELTIEYCINNPDFCFSFPFKINDIDSDTFIKITKLQYDIFSNKFLFIDLQKTILKLKKSYLLIKETQFRIEKEKKLIIINHFNKTCSDMQFLTHIAGSQEQWFYSLCYENNKISFDKNSFEERSETFEIAYHIYNKYFYKSFTHDKDTYKEFKSLFDFDYSNPNYKINILNFYIINGKPYFRSEDMTDIFYSESSINNKIFMKQNENLINILFEEVCLSKNIENF